MTGSSLRSGVTAGIVLVALGAAACGSSSSSGGSTQAPAPNAKESSPPGDIPDNQAFVRFKAPGGFTLEVPEGWAQRTTGGAVIFTDKLNAIRIESHGASAPLTVKAARSAELQQLSRSVKGFRAGTVSTVARRAGAAVRITYLASAPADPVTGKAVTDAVERYVFFHHGRAVVLTLSGPKGADNVDPWRLVTDSVRWSR